MTIVDNEISSMSQTFLRLPKILKFFMKIFQNQATQFTLIAYVSLFVRNGLICVLFCLNLKPYLI